MIVDTGRSMEDDFFFNPGQLLHSSHARK